MSYGGDYNYTGYHHMLKRNPVTVIRSDLWVENVSYMDNLNGWKCHMIHIWFCYFSIFWFGCRYRGTQNRFKLFQVYFRAIYLHNLDGPGTGLENAAAWPYRSSCDWGRWLYWGNHLYHGLYTWIFIDFLSCFPTGDNDILCVCGGSAYRHNFWGWLARIRTQVKIC